MNPAERLLSFYARAADAPEAAPRLRRFVLDLAVRGKLAEQDPADLPASELLKRIAAEKARLIELKAIRRQKIISPVTSPPFRIPKNWRWVHFGEIAEFSAGKTPPRHEPVFWDGNEYPWVCIGDMQDGKTIVKTKEKVSEEARCRIFKSPPTEPRTIILSFKLTIGKISRLGVPAYFNEAIISIKPHVNDIDPYLFMFLPFFARSGKTIGAVKGATLNRESISNILIPFPPLAEQHRIVAKVDELMTLCDRLEASREKREENRDRLTKASLCRLSRLDTDLSTFRSHARFAIKALPALTSRADQIKQLRQSILDLAVRGKLAEQDPADEPASELLKRIAAEKARPAHPRKTKGLALPESFSTNDYPFPLPRTWILTRIADLGVLSPRNRIGDDRIASFVPMPLIPDEWGKTNAHKNRPWGEIKKGYTHFAEGDVGVAKITPCFENRKSVVFRNLAGGIGSGTTELHVIRPVLMNANYILLFLKSSLFIENGISKMTGTAGQKRVPKEYFANSPFPLPPLAEQHRIVAKVDELMTFCDHLEANLGFMSKRRHRYLESLISNFLEDSDTLQELQEPSGAVDRLRGSS